MISELVNSSASAMSSPILLLWFMPDLATRVKISRGWRRDLQRVTRTWSCLEYSRE
jgi:hypothetical protein